MNDSLDLTAIADASGTEKRSRSAGEDNDLMDMVLSTRTPMVADWTRRGALIASIFFGALILWSVFAPLPTGANIAGRIIVSGDRDVVEHLEGGIVKKVHVKSGAEVKSGDVIIEMSSAPADARLRDTQTRIYALRARLERLQAEWLGEKTLSLSPPNNSDVSIDAQNEILSLEYSQFSIRSGLVEAQVKSMKETIDDNLEIAASLREQKARLKTQLDLIDEELADINGLFDKGLAPKSRVLALRRTKESLLSDELGLESRIVEQNNRVQAARLELENFISGSRGEIAEQMQTTQVELQSHYGNLELAEDQKRRTVITASRDGIVMDVRAKSSGEVIEPGAPLFDLVPAGAKLIVDGRLAADDGAAIRRGLPARITVAAFKGRNAPTLTGTVLGVSPDILTDERTGEAYYSVQLEFDQSSVGSLNADNELQPGYPVQALIETDSQPIIYYLLSPLTTSIRNALTER